MTPDDAKQKRDRLGHTDFDGAFTPGTVFLKEGGEVEIKVSAEGRLCIPSGTILVSDQYISKFEAKRPFARQVPPGEYPVLLSIAGSDVCCMMVRFSDEPTLRWEMAERDREKPDSLASGDYLLFSVDSGCAAFADGAGAKRIGSDREWMDRISETRRAPGEMTIRLTIDEQTGAGMVTCHAGIGDGGYCCYWGLNQHGEPTCLVADFAILVEPVYSECTIPEVGGHLAQPLQHEWFDRHGYRDVSFEQNTEGEITLWYTGRDFLEPSILDEQGVSVVTQLSSGWEGGDEPGTRRFKVRYMVSGDLSRASLHLKRFDQYRALPRKS